MNTIIMHIIINFQNYEYIEPSKLSLVDYFTIIEAIISAITLVIGVILGTKYITTTRNNAQFGFYVNLLVIIERYKALLDNNSSVTNYLVEKELRLTYYKTTMPSDQADKIIPLFVSLCDDFLKLVQSANNNIAPKRKKQSPKSQAKDWNDWYDNICNLVSFSQKCKLLEKKITPYISEESIGEYDKEKNDFFESLDFIHVLLKDSLKYQKKYKSK